MGEARRQDRSGDWRSFGGSARRRSDVSSPRARAWHSAIGTASRGQRVAAELETAGARVAFTQADVSTEAACLAFVNGAAQKFGRLGILINNAGIRKYEKVDEASAASWNEILSVNLMSYVFCAKAAVPLMRGNKGGAIVNVASVRSVVAGGGNLQDATPPRLPSRASDARARRRPLAGWHSWERRRPRPDLHAVPCPPHCSGRRNRRAAQRQGRTRHHAGSASAGPREVAAAILFFGLRRRLGWSPALCYSWMAA